jgi:hypothetical protein
MARVPVGGDDGAAVEKPLQVAGARELARVGPDGVQLLS